MNNTLLVISREYLTRVKKKSFLLTTILVPIIIIAFYAAIIYLTVKGDDSSKSIAIIDNAGLFSQTPKPEKSKLTFTLIKGETEKSFTEKYKDEGYEGFLYIPPFSLDSPKNIILHSPSSIGLSTSFEIDDLVNEALVNKRLVAQGIDINEYKRIQSKVSISNAIDTKEGSKRGVAGVAYGVSFACGILIYMMMIVYGTQVMRGVMEEKTNRIAEIMVSSVKPFQLMMGKIMGIGAVGLTQFGIWLIMILIFQITIPLFFPGMTAPSAAASNIPTEELSGAAGIMEGLSALPLLKIGILFIVYFLGGYLTYASLFAAVGSVVSDDQQEAQQLIFPILMPIILGFVIMSNAVSNPHSTMAVFGSLFPLTSPIVMMGRVAFDVPWWQIFTSIFLLAGSFFLFTWLTAKIYRIGILMYGKKPSWKEMIKWVFRKS